jgi:uncharacterized protein (TIGR02996 family)
MNALYPHRPLLALLRAAREQLDDDSPRLILADWLEEHGDAQRAEFLRLQCALGPGSAPLHEAERSRAARRAAALLNRCGGAWLGPLWRHGGTWHRGLLAVELDRHHVPDHFADLLPWIDTLHLEVAGREALRWALQLLAGSGVNHVTLRLRRPFPAETLLAFVGEAPGPPLLRALTLRWPPGLALRTGSSVYVNLPVEFFKRLVSLPLCRSLTHLGSSFHFLDPQAFALRCAGVAPVLERDLYWPHRMPPAAFRRRST